MRLQRKAFTALPDQPQTGPCLKVERVTKRFGTFVALKDISFSVASGEFVCLLGPSGCGKTTLLRTIAGLESQSDGRIEQYGRDVSLLPAAQRDFGIVFQSYALFPNLTVFQNIAYGLVARRQPADRIKKRVGELLDLIGLQDESGKYPGQISGGQQQRVALARAIAAWPGLLLLDEPLSALDAQVRVSLREELRMLQQRVGIPTIMVTHDQEEALALADRVILMNRGHIEQIGTPPEVYNNPASEFVARFVGASTSLPGILTTDGRVRVGNAEFSAAAEDRLSHGDAVTVCIRPEYVTVTSANAYPGQLAVSVRSKTFMGSHWRLELRLVDAPEFSLKADIADDLQRKLALEIGSQAWIFVDPDRVRVFPRTAK
ncbi:putative 2-aminoethylphosphonate ABC transporter ATP-binding protein [Rhodoligotrophos defluvii]|uniref:putative 2-aminoethylphosphonate ABC transporter ATP-binding protein n=1 Tax=Rhodoligotrophos defluvii TaxID=2561934 RepID=UPI0010C96108|nr:putative 2-aminoethylphosphonate ABC transporter ATP-binding protein [Rhodoligotrophos defluvii]